MAFNIVSGKQSKPQRVVIYGAEGIGKTTLAAQCPDPLFIDLEQGSAYLDVRRAEGIKSWRDLIDAINTISQTETLCQTIVIDTADKSETLCSENLCRTKSKGSIEDFGFGKGYTMLAEEYGKLLAACDNAVSHGINVVIVAHAKMRKMELPDEQGAFDRWELKLSKHIAPMIKEWADALLFCNYKTIVVVDKDGKGKAHGGKRVIYTSHSPVWDAKNRHGLAEELPLEWSSVAPIFANYTPKKTIWQVLKERMDADGIKDEELREVVSGQGHFTIDTQIGDYPPDFINQWVFVHWGKIKETIELNRQLPF